MVRPFLIFKTVSYLYHTCKTWNNFLQFSEQLKFDDVLRENTEKVLKVIVERHKHHSRTKQYDWCFRKDSELQHKTQFRYRSNIAGKKCFTMSPSAFTPNCRLVVRIHFIARAKGSNKSHEYTFDILENLCDDNDFDTIIFFFKKTWSILEIIHYGAFLVIIQCFRLSRVCTFSKYVSCPSNSNKRCGLGSSGMLRSVS